ncbi:MAG: hypothetical protein K0U36_03710 [Alphaproteobacteria bacterium]|nr:hypothetical protein [Alphaproteobacteria bacterium]
MKFLDEYKTYELISITHRENGAWAQCYRPRTHGIEIPNKLIGQEYKEFYNAE